MNDLQESVPPYHTLGSGTAVRFQKSGTLCGTSPGTSSLKALAVKVLSGKQAVQPVVHTPVQQRQKCTTGKSGGGTLFEIGTDPSQKRQEAVPPYTDAELEAIWSAAWIDHWRASCSAYPEGCWSCPDGDVRKRVFCRKHPRPAWAGDAGAHEEAV